MTEKAFATAANILSTMPSGQPWDDRMATVYAIGMQKWSDDLVERTVMQCLMTKKFRPTVAELREVALGIRRVKVSTGQAAEQIRHIILMVQPNQRAAATERLVKEGKVSPSVPILVQNLGGWRNVGMMAEDRLFKAVDTVQEHIDDDPQIDEALATPAPTLEGKTIRMIGEA
jgi:hypothetical protein